MVVADRHARRAAVALAVMSCLPAVFASRVLAQSGGEPLFPRAFVVEHKVTRTDASGATSESPAVTDHYGGSWIVSVRPDGGRTIVDFGRREITTVEPERGTYTVIGFDRLAELRLRLQRAEVRPSETEGAKNASAASVPAARVERPSFVFEELPAGQALPARASAAQARPGVRRLRVSLEQAPGRQPAAGPAVEVWCDSQVRLEPRAREELARFEAEVIGGPSETDDVPLSAFVAAAREHAEGAIPVRTVRPLSARTGAGRLEDVVTQLELETAFPIELLKIPEGLRRVPHPLELMVAFAEEEAARR